MAKQKIVLFLIFFVCLNHESFSQIGAQPTTGCAPLQVNFTAPAGATNANWNFGNGSSILLNPSNVFNTPGVYTVLYTGAGGNPTNGSILITVTANTVTPLFNFTIPPLHCAPMTVNFICTGGPPGSTFQWAFGDGGLGNLCSQSYVYSLGGIFSPTLAVTDLAGCTGTVTNGPINVSTPPLLNISSSPGLTSCLAPFTTAFSASLSTTGSPFGGPLTYNWNFGNSQSSTLQTPGNITYNAQGTYNVILSATDNNNCSSSISDIVSVFQPTMIVTGPGTVCAVGQSTAYPNETGFTIQIQTDAGAVSVNTGDGNTANLSVPSATAPIDFIYNIYPTIGPHTITVTANTGSCVVTQTLSVFVESVTPQFSATPLSNTCSPTFVASMVNQSTVNSGSSLSYSWRVEHWNHLVINQYTSSLANPTFTLTQQSLSSYAWYGMYVPVVYLKVVSSSGCGIEIAQYTDTMWRPTAWFNKNKKDGCVPLVVEFRDSSSVSPFFPVTSYTWNNGASPATLITGTVPPPIVQPTFTYSAPGTYTPFYTFVTTGGCSAKSFVDTIIVVNQPTVSSTFTPNLSVCVGQPVQIHLSASPSSSLIQHWHAESDDGFYSGCINDSMPDWPFTHPGVHGFTISAYDHGCKSEAVSTQTLTVKGPLARFRFQTNCTNKKSVDFSSFLNEVQTATLNFGDGNFSSIAGNATGIVSDFTTHVYASRGDYTASITGYNTTTGCGPSTQSMVIKVREINASFFVAKPLMCKGDIFQFNATASTDVFTTCNRGYAWALDTTSALLPEQSTMANYTYTFAPFDPIPGPGTHTITLWVKDANSCTAMQTKTFFIATPVASFSFANPACMSSMPLQLVNTTTNSPVAPVSFTWDFGIAGAPLVVANSVTMWPTVSYTAPQPSQNYTIMLVAAGTYSLCTDTCRKLVTVINPPEAFIYAFETRPCVDAPAIFSTPFPGITYTVNFGDSSLNAVNSASTISHTYTATGVYDPTLTLAYGGCLSLSPPGQGEVIVQAFPVTDFTFFPTLTPAATGSIFCAPVSITFSSTSMANGPGFNWDLGTGSPITSSVTVGTIFTSVGIHTISLSSYSVNPQCSTSITKSISVLNPLANMTIDRTKICLGETINMNIKDTSNVFGWIWYYGDGSKDSILAGSSPPAGVSHPYTNFPLPAGATSVNLVYYSSAYSCTHTATFAIQVNKVDAAFDRNLEQLVKDSVHCLRIPDQFTNESKFNNGTFIATLGFTWDFGDGNNSAALSPNHIYQNAGVYTVSLIAIDGSLGCKNTAVKHMTINPIPEVSIAVPDSICSGSHFVLTSTTSTDVSKYQWSPAFGVANPNSATTTVTASISTTYSLNVTSIYGCKNSSKPEFVYIQQPSPSVIWDTTVIAGQVITIHSHPGTNYTYTWSPISNLSCTNCLNVTSTTTTNITYSVVVEDNMMCFKVISTYAINVDPQTTVDVPTAFTPNGDGVNDIIYVDGWGIKKLDYFRIFNRWGQLLFESNDIKVGWDGTYNGVPQNMETYVYQVSAETYLAGKSLQKSSTFRLIR